MHQIVLFSGFLRAPNRAFLSFLRAPNRAFLWFSSCTKSCFFVVFFVHQMVPQFMLFFLMILLHTPNRALVRALLSFSSCTKSCFFLVFFVHQVVLFLVFFVHQIVLFLCFLPAPNRAFFYFSSCTKSCIFLVFFVHQIVLFCGLLRAPNGALLRATVTEVRQDTIYIYIKLYKYMSCCQNSLSSLSSREKGIAFGGALSLSAVL